MRRWSVHRVATARFFLRVLGAIYAIAFVSFGVQAMGLAGSHGILPAAEYLHEVRAATGAAYWREMPTLLWINSSDVAITALWIAGAVLGLVAAAGFRSAVMATSLELIHSSVGI